MNAVLLVQQLREGHIDAAQRTLAQTPAGVGETVPVLLDICAVEVTERGPAARGNVRIARAAVGSAAFVSFLVLIALAAADSPVFIAAFIALIGGIALTDPLKWYRPVPTTLQENAAISLLAHADGTDSRVTGALIDALACDGAETRVLVRGAITPLIWSMDADEAALWLDAERRGILREQVRAHYRWEWRQPHRFAPPLPHLRARRDFSDTETDFLIATVRALATLRDPKGRRLLAQVAMARTVGPNSETIGLAAAECLSIARESQAAWRADAERLAGLLESGKRDAAASVLRGLPGPRQVALLLDYLRRAGGGKRRLASLLVGDFRATPTPAEVTAGALLARYNDARLAGPAIDILERTRLDPVRDALPTWLMEMTPGSGGILKERHRCYLRRLLDTPSEWRVGGRASAAPGVAALHALGVAGDLEVLPQVGRIVRAESPIPERHRSQSVRDAAYDCWLRLSESRERRDAHRPPRP